MFSINLVTLDSYQSAPLPELDVTFSDFRGNEIRQVPVIRIFGSTLSGIKTCLHIHGVFPYIYIPCTRYTKMDNNLDSFMYKLAAAIDSAINVSLGSAMSKTQHVHKIQKVSGIPLYGYHEKEHLFLKIFFYNPAMIKRAADLLQNGNILNQSLQPHEAHIPFTLQFMVDYNLYGMSLINLKDVKVRQCIPRDTKEESQNESSLKLFDLQKYLPASIHKQSTCKLELDALACEILNRQEIQNGIDLNPGIAAIWNEESHRRQSKGLQLAESQLLYTYSDNRVYVPTANDIYQEKQLMKRLQSIAQLDEHITPVTSILSYPLQAEDGDKLFSASHVLNHFQSSPVKLEFKSEILLNNELLNVQKSIPSKNSHHHETMECSILDSEDMQLVEILVGLAGESEEEKVVDNDSMLGSQFSTFSDKDKEQSDDDDNADLNITSLDLDNFSSWDSVTKVTYQSDKLETEKKTGEGDEERDHPIKNSIQNNSLLDFPQCDGSTDLFSKNKCFKCKPNHTCESKNKCRKARIHVQPIVSHCTNTSFFKLDHQDLDVYDVDDVEHQLTSCDYENLENSPIDLKNCTNINSNKLPVAVNDVNNLNISALDGNTVDSPSDSDKEQDITITKDEERVCLYKSSIKSKHDDNILSTSGKRQRIKVQDANFESPYKRRNTNVDCGQYESHRTPTKVRTSQSPRVSAKRYSPLNITIISPKANKHKGINRDCSFKSSCCTPKCNKEHLRKSLFREKINDLTSETKQVSPSYNDNSNNHNISQLITKDERWINEKFIHFNKEGESTSQKSYKMQSLSKHSKAAKKKLSILNTSEEDIVSKTDDIDYCHLDSSSLTEKSVDNSHQNNDPTNISIINPAPSKKSEGIYPEENSEMYSEYNLSSISTKEVNSYIDSSLARTVIINVNDVDKDDVCNMTYTQYLNSKLCSVISSSIATSPKRKNDTTQNRIIIVTTKFNPPSPERIIKSMKMYNISISKFNMPFFSNKNDLMKQRQSSNKYDNDLGPFKCGLDGVTGIKLWRRVKMNEFYPSGSTIKSCDVKRALAGYSALIIQPLIQPPTVKDAKSWLQIRKYLLKRNCKKIEVKDNIININICTKEINVHNKTSIDYPHIKGHTQQSNSSMHSVESNDSINASLQEMLEKPLLYKNIDSQQHLGISYGQIEFSLKGNIGNVESENLQVARGLTVHQYLTILSIEVHIVTREKLLPDPDHDLIEAVFYAIHNDVPSSSKAEQIEHGAIVVNSSIRTSKIRDIHSTSTFCTISYVSSEEHLLNSLIVLVRHCDPDILAGWEIESLSWGYIFHRASNIGMNNFMWQVSRIPNVTVTPKAQVPNTENFADAKIPGRIVLDIWRIMRHEIALLSYTFENVMYNVMRERISCPSFQTLTEWWRNKSVIVQWRVITHYIIRVVGTLRILMHLDIIGRTCEHARLIGIQFYEIFSRGSQFRVESMMLRLAKPLNYIAVSPSVQQRARMRAPESLPLIMEPQSIFYGDPLIVLDFQSLYPSIIIAYNYCFSTCLGRVEHIGQSEPYEFGATTLKVNKTTAEKFLGKINFSPCGVAFVKPEVRTGILPRMLTEILNTRLMIKQSMKMHGNENHILQRVLHSQQLGLKLIANVTYGYTAANFSGRMPCIEIGDSVVSKGRETLERAIKIVDSTPKWGAQVVYGDTDSLFILLPGKSRKDAFAVGMEIADTVTAANPPPIKLKFEKVLQPAILQTKKRYCGYMYETPDKEEPVYFAKGIETVRRDGCPAVTKILEKTLKILFDTKDLSLIKLYVTRQFDKILRRKISIQDLTFAKEFRGLRGYKPIACVPALELTRRLMRKDPRALPRTGERVRYVIVAGAPNQSLIHCVRTPMEVMSDENLSPNSIYYITKVIIPPLNRCLNLIGIDANTWYREMAHRQTSDKVFNLCVENQKLTIQQFFNINICAACGEQTQRDICTKCIAKPHQTITILYEKLRWLERTYHELITICQSCTGYLEEPHCESLECPVLYRLIQARRDLIQVPYLNDIIHSNQTLCIQEGSEK